jgi:predicted GIY-YIG superfamily endonuclease
MSTPAITNNLATAVLEAADVAASEGVVYLLHFDRPYRHAAHYTGWTINLLQRLDDHANGRGARLLAVITQAGIGFTLARTWPGSRKRERALKRQGGAARRCPLCGMRASANQQTSRELAQTTHQLTDQGVSSC